ncbi:MAG: quinolinate synthase NadA [Clostridia bacterium]|nr:quinolinate synthase NadA [Clostridia bacterium]
MTIREMQDEILRLKKEKDVCILAHTYQTNDILEIADFTGDSFGLSVKAQSVPQQNILMCGVRFMAETVKLLSPQKHVYLSNDAAGCPLADQADRDLVLQLREQMPDYCFVVYINSTAETKAVCDVCVTSSSAVKIVKNIGNPNIFFLPDCNLGDFVKQQVPEKNIELMRGGCPTHLRVTPDEVRAAKAAHPGAPVLVHPECRPEVVALADYVGSTTGIIARAEKGEEKEYIIGTENSVRAHLQMNCPGKRFYPLSKDCVCHNMQITTIADVYNMLRYGKEELAMSDELIAAAVRPVNEMLRLGE